MDSSLLNLPLQVQVALASGYAAYLTANMGIRGHHTATETTFGSLAYGLVASGILLTFPRDANKVLAGATAFVLTIFAGMFWRKIGCQLWFKTLRFLHVSWADDSPSAWMALGTNTENYVTQIGVLLDDGTWLRCDDTSLFGKAPFGPCILGPKGDLAIYLTHEETADGAVKTLKTVHDEFYGTRLTYIPADRVRRVTIRHNPIS